MRVIAFIQAIQIRNLRSLFYELASNFTSPGFVKQRLGSRPQFITSNQSTNSIYHEMMSNTEYGCVKIGAVVPPASINDTILYNVIGIDIIGIGSDVSSNQDSTFMNTSNLSRAIDNMEVYVYLQ